MRASLGFRAGPLYIGTGNLLKSKPRGKQQHSGTEVMVWLIIAPFLLVYFTGAILWVLAVSAWNGSVRLATRTRDAQPVIPAEPEDDPAWTVGGRQ